MEQRHVVRQVRALDTSDGAGVKLRRSLGSPQLDALDPFLLLDEFGSDRADDYIAGFPEHPHRGFETVTYMLAGHMEHRDHTGRTGTLTAGAVQWMTAGRGILHSEMPRQVEGLMRGFQLWVNLPAAEKMRAPRYQEFPPEAIPRVELPGGVRVVVVAGECAGVAGAVSGIATQPLYLDVALPAGATFEQELPAAHSCCVYVFEGSALVGDTRAPVAAGHLAVLSAGETLTCAAGEAPARFLLLAARPLREPVARRGPFVMNTDAELRQAFADYRNGTLAG
jgi:hypothetical protein